MKKNRKSTKRATAILLAMLMVLTCVPSAFAASSKPTIKKVDYEKYGKVEVDFTTDVRYRNAKISVKDASGNRYSAYFTDRKNYEDDVEFIVENYKAGRTYNFTISGIKRAYSSGSYTSVNGTFKIPAANAKPKIKKVNYEKSGKVEVDFTTDVRYRNAKISVKDASGNRYSAYFTDRKNYEDDVEFIVKNYKAGRTYTFTISGIKRAYSSGSYTSVTGTFKIPAANSVKVKKVEYDDEDREVTFEFANNVTWKNYRPTVKITTMNGTQKKVTFLDKDRDEVEVRANLTPGQKYKYTIYGVKARGASAYKNVSGTFRAIDD